MGSGRLVPGVDYKDFALSATLRLLWSPRSKCSRCFGIRSLEEGPAAEELAAESLNSSSSSSSAREPAPKKKRKKAAEYCVLLHALWRVPRSGSPNALAIALFKTVL